METGAINDYIDVAQLTLYAFWVFFFLLIFYIRKEDRREGYPLENDVQTGRPAKPSRLLIPDPKTFHLPDGSTKQAPSPEPERQINATRTAVWSGAPYVPNGDPLSAGVGPGSYAQRSNKPDADLHGQPRIAPLRSAGSFSVAEEDHDPRGMKVVGADGKVAGEITDVWVDRMEMLARYFEVKLAGEAGGTVLLPVTFSKVDGRRGKVHVSALFSDQFGGVPALANPDQVTLLEEDRITAYYGAGTLYASRQRTESLL
jgi:photosynthetic reaction center H subunit